MTTKTKNIMTTKLVTIPMGSPLLRAHVLMIKENFRHLPVVDANGDIVGILSQRDLTHIQYPETILVDYFMSSPVVYIEQDTPLREAIDKMLQMKISCLLVSDEDANAVGILTTDDLLSYLSSLLREESDGKSTLLSMMNLRTVGDVANQLSNVGI